MSTHTHTHESMSGEVIRLLLVLSSQVCIYIAHTNL